MIPGTCLEIRTSAFPPIEGEGQSIINPGMYGARICGYLQAALQRVGYEIPGFCNEDWGWWITVAGLPFPVGLLVYSHLDQDDRVSGYCIIPSVTKEAVWVWRRLHRIPATPIITKLMNDVQHLFAQDERIMQLIIHDDFPY